MNKFPLAVLPERYAVSKLPPDFPTNQIHPPPGGFFAYIQEPEAKTLVCEESLVPGGAVIESGWRAIKVIGSLDFSLIGILADISGILAEAGVSIIAISTYLTDYILVRDETLTNALRALKNAGHDISSEE